MEPAAQTVVRLTPGGCRLYSEDMRGGQLLSLFLAAAIFVLQGGDCVSLLFGNKQAHDCCRKGHCSPKNPDPCCQVSSKATVTQDQAKEKAPLADLAVLPSLTAWTRPVILAPVDPEARYDLMFAPSPPGQLGNFSLPLLV